MKKPIILASQSKARLVLMEEITNNFIVKISNVDETIPKSIKPEDIPVYLSNLKAACIKKAYPDYTVIGADTLAFIGNEPVGKPKDKHQAEDFLRRMSATSQRVITGVSVYYGDSVKSFTEISYIDFINIDESIIKKYIETSIPYDKAGGIAVEEAGEFSFIKNVRGSFSNVMGLPVESLKRVLENLSLL